MSGDQDPARGEVKAAVPLVVRGVPEEHTASRTGRQLVRSSGGEVGVASALKDSKVIIGGRGAKESEVRCGGANRLGGKAIEQVGGVVHSLSPEARRD